MENLKQKLKEIYNKEINVLFNQDIMIDATGVEGFNFIIPEDTTIELKSNITDYTLENNEMIQSGVALQPITISLSGTVGELYLKAPLTEQMGDNVVQAGLNQLSAFAPKLSTMAQQYYNKITNIANKVETAFNKVNGAFNYIDSLVNSDQKKTEQEKIFNMLRTLWKSRELFKVITCYSEFDNCILEQVGFTQNGDTRFASKINMSIKVMTFAKQIKTSKEVKITQVQKSDKKNNGTQDVSILKKGFNQWLK